MSKLKVIGNAMSKIGRAIGSRDATARGQAMLKKAPAVDAKKKAAVNSKMVSPDKAVAAKKPNQYGEYSVYNTHKGKKVGGARGEELRGYQSTREDAVSTAKAETKRYNAHHRAKIGLTKRKK